MRVVDLLLGAFTLVTLAFSLALAPVALQRGKLPLFNRYSPPLVKGVDYISVEQARYYIDQPFVFLDAREKAAYEAGHVRGAAHWSPFEPTTVNPDQLKTATGLVVYCDGPGCGASSKLARELLSQGFTRVLVMTEGYPGWVSRGYPTVTGTAAGSGDK
ncbi:MAG: hypothetical protein KC910_26340 [Candidatus Eremiobacteraeota bacterium]|nr:hypothetical protein [Candidatus Eremiobacteraeota bacterium]